MLRRIFQNVANARYWFTPGRGVDNGRHTRPISGSLWSLELAQTTPGSCSHSQMKPPDGPVRPPKVR